MVREEVYFTVIVVVIVATVDLIAIYLYLRTKP